jgi:hypothetical protein
MVAGDRGDGHGMRHGGGADSTEAAPAAARGGAAADGFAEAGAGAAFKPGAVYVLRDGKPARVAVRTGLGDGASYEIESDDLEPGDAVIVGLEATAQNRNLQPPPGMGGPRFGPPGGGRRPTR